MEVRESVLDTIFDDEGIEDGQDVEMQDVEEGELVEPISKAESGVSCDVAVNQVSNKRNSRRKKEKKKKKNKQKTDSDIGPNVNGINRFVLDVCERMRERKSYLMYTAVGCLGISALSDLIKEVDAIQACGGQKTFDGGRFRNGGGVLWNIIKVREPNAYKEIMRKGKEFEKQFKQHYQNKQPHAQQTESSSQSSVLDTANQSKPNISNDLELLSHDQNQLEQPCAGEKHTSVYDRIRMPVTYYDLLEGEDLKMDRTCERTIFNRQSPNLHPNPPFYTIFWVRDLFFLIIFFLMPLGWRNDQKHEPRLIARFFMYSNFLGLQYDDSLVSISCFF